MKQTERDLQEQAAQLNSILRGNSVATILLNDFISLE